MIVAQATTRLLLIGDDEALDLLAELTPHLPHDELVRADEIPPRALDDSDVLVLGMQHAHARDLALREAMQGAPRHVAIVHEERKVGDAGARAILVAAELVRLLLPETVG